MRPENGRKAAQKRPESGPNVAWIRNTLAQNKPVRGNFQQPEPNPCQNYKPETRPAPWKIGPTQP